MADEIINHAWTDQKASWLSKLRVDALAANAEYRASHTDWDDPTDVRVTALVLWTNVITSTALGIIMIQRYMLYPNWWRETLNIEASLETDEAIEIMQDEYLMFHKLGLVNGIFMVIERTFRLYVRAIDMTACNNGRADLENIAKYLLARCDLRGYQPALDVLRNMRNSLHNNGVFFPKNGNDLSIGYRDMQIEFKVGEPISFTWDFLLTLVTDLQRMYIDILRHPVIVQLASIPDDLRRN